MAKKILLIEDETDQVVLMRKRFESCGYDFFYALDGVDGLKKAEEIVPDLILLDLNLPQMSGFDVLKNLQRHSELKKIPVFVITARADKYLGENCRKSGAEEVIFKPYDSRELLDLIKKRI